MPVTGSLSEQTAGVSFFTNRSVDTDSTGLSYFGNRRGQPSWGQCLVELGDTTAARVDAEVKGVVREEQQAVLGAMQPGRLVVYVHGYNIGFEKGCRRGARLQHNLGVEGQLLLFGWPADGNYLNYLRDLADLQWSERELEAVLKDLADRYGAGNVDLIGHSLGAAGLVSALVHMTDIAPFRSLTLAAPDVDRDLFVRDLPLLGYRARRITVYTSGNDRALKVSRRANGYPRAGQSAPGLSYPGVDLVDITDTEARGISGHIYHLYNPAVVEDLRHVLGVDSGARRYHRVVTESAFALERVPDS